MIKLLLFSDTRNVHISETCGNRHIFSLLDDAYTEINYHDFRGGGGLISAIIVNVAPQNSAQIVRFSRSNR